MCSLCIHCLILEQECFPIVKWQQLACSSIVCFFSIRIRAGEECFCRDWHGCIMAQSIVGLENVQPYKFSECSKKDYIDALRIGHGLCLLNKPNEVSVSFNCNDLNSDARKSAQRNIRMIISHRS